MATQFAEALGCFHLRPPEGAGREPIPHGLLPDGLARAFRRHGGREEVLISAFWMCQLLRAFKAWNIFRADDGVRRSLQQWYLSGEFYLHYRDISLAESNICGHSFFGRSRGQRKTHENIRASSFHGQV